MNTDPQKSCQSCGCDEGALHQCEQHSTTQVDGKKYFKATNAYNPGFSQTSPERPLPQIPRTIAHIDGLFPNSTQGRKDHPVFTGVLMYFPDAIAAVALVSKLGNDQHNPGQSLRWAREKSTDQTDTATRHMMDHGTGNIKDTDGTYHLAKAAWRVLAELQLTIEKDKREGR